MRLMFAFAFFTVLGGVPATAEELTPDEASNRMVRAMEAEKWEEALEIVDAFIEDWEDWAEPTNPTLCIAYFHKGLCEGKLENFGEAARSFEFCYKGLTWHLEALRKR